MEHFTATPSGDPDQQDPKQIQTSLRVLDELERISASNGGDLSEADVNRLMLEEVDRRRASQGGDISDDQVDAFLDELSSRATQALTDKTDS